MRNGPRGPWYWLTLLSPVLGSLASRNAGREASEDSEAALRDLLPALLLIAGLMLVVLVVAGLLVFA